MLGFFLFCGRDCCIWCLGIPLGSRPGSLLAVCILRTDFFVPAYLAAVDDSLCCCRVYMLFCGGAVVDQTVADVAEGIVQLLEEESWVTGRSLSMPSWRRNIAGFPMEVVRSSTSWRGDFRGCSSCSRRLLLALNIQLCFLSMSHFCRSIPSYGMSFHSLLGQASFRRLRLATSCTPQ